LRSNKTEQGVEEIAVEKRGSQVVDSVLKKKKRAVEASRQQRAVEYS
jgi:hypothetical protein